MPAQARLHITLFQPADQAAARALILDGLVGHWGFLDPTKNPDLNDIAASYAGAAFFVGRLEGELVATGVLVPRGADEAEIVRMSVAKGLRRAGLGRQMLKRLVEQARQWGCRRITLETTSAWSEVVAFYLGSGFTITHHQDGDTYFSLELAESAA